MRCGFLEINFRMEKAFHDPFQDHKQKAPDSTNNDELGFLLRTPPERHSFQTPKMNMVLSQCVSNSLVRFDLFDQRDKAQEEDGEYSVVDKITQGNTEFSISPLQDFGSLFDARVRQILEHPNFLASETDTAEVRRAADALNKTSRIHSEGGDNLSIQTGKIRKFAVDTPSSDQKCNCKNSQCVKLYCKCFRTQSFCKDCSCSGCFNTTDNNVRRSMLKALHSRNVLGFPTPFSSRSASLTHPHSAEKRNFLIASSDVKPLVITTRGCNCKNSRCQKRYCECFLNNLGCGSQCKCTDCLNRDSEGGETGANDSNGQPINEGEVKQQLITKLREIKRIKFKVGE